MIFRILLVALGLVSLTTGATPLAHEGIEVAKVFGNGASHIVVFGYGRNSELGGQIFWRPSGSAVLYQMLKSQFTGSRDSFEVDVLAPRSDAPERTARIYARDASVAHVMADGRVASFELLTDADRLELQRRILAGEVSLRGLPTVLQFEYAFKIDGRDTHVVVLSNKFKSSYDYQVFIGAPNHLRAVEVADVRRYRDGGTTEIRLKDGRLIYSPSRLASKGPAQLRSPDGAVDLIPIERSPALAEKLGLDPRPLKIPELETPASGVHRCDVFLTPA